MQQEKKNGSLKENADTRSNMITWGCYLAAESVRGGWAVLGQGAERGGPASACWAGAAVAAVAAFARAAAERPAAVPPTAAAAAVAIVRERERERERERVSEHIYKKH